MNGKKKEKKTSALAWVGRNFGVQDCHHRFHRLFSRCYSRSCALKLISSKPAAIYLCCYDVIYSHQTAK